MPYYFSMTSTSGSCFFTILVISSNKPSALSSSCSVSTQIKQSSLNSNTSLDFSFEFVASEFSLLATSFVVDNPTYIPI